MNKYLTITELEKQTDIPNSTCRRYIASFEAFFEAKGGSRLKKYDSSAVNILKRIKYLYDEGLETHEIFDVLQNEFPIVVNSEEQQETNEPSSVIPALATSEEISEIKQALDEQKQFNQALLQKMNEQHLYYEKKFEELKGDRDFFQLLGESMKQQKLESSDHKDQMTKQLETISQQLTEMKKAEEVKELSDKVVELTSQFQQVQQSLKEAAVSSEEPKKKKGLWAWLTGE